ncbi:MAG: hypothetical protein HOH33_14855 [Verrucomicrobia bacterium]|jgi:nitrogen fixation protein FixH|nr:hypothetical protein [Verrucomicrobiota bacterium]
MMPKIHPWPATIIAYFSIVLCGATTLVVYSIKHKAHLVRTDYYEQEVKYQDQIERINRTHPFLEKIKAEITQKDLVLRLPDTHTSSPDFSGSIWLYRPSNSGLDQRFELKPNPSGVFQQEVENLLDGLWKLKVNWTAQGQEFYYENSMVTDNL